jgi:homoserine dehydrogenase
MASRFYLRLTVTDQPGVLAEIAALLAAQEISVASVIQHEMPDDGANASATVVIMTHAAPAGKLQAALQAINESRHSCEPGVAYRVM